MVNKVNQVASEFRKVSNKQMAETTKRTIRDNVSITAQLDKMSDKTMELIAENDDLKKKNKEQRQKIEMLEDNEKEILKKNHSNQKVNYCQAAYTWLFFKFIKNSDVGTASPALFDHFKTLSFLFGHKFRLHGKKYATEIVK